MAKIVFILGAGASLDAGAPQMADFLDVAENLWLTKRVSGEIAECFKDVFQARSMLSLVNAKSQLDIINVESVFSAFEMANILKKLGDLEPEQIASLVKAMKTVIVHTIDNSVWFPFGDEDISGAGHYRALSELITRVIRNSYPPKNVAFITFNYDIALDLSLHLEGIKLFYGFEREPDASSVPVLKLHGSVNWAQCSKCDEVFPLDVGVYIKRRNGLHFFNNDRSRVFVPVASQIGTCVHDKDQAPALPEPVVVPPTWNKSEHYKGIARVWARAAKELSEAENIFIIGYSLPESDLFFRYLFALGTASNQVLKRLWVFNPDDAVEKKVRQMLGPSALQSFAYPVKPQYSNFGDSIRVIDQALIHGVSLGAIRREFKARETREDPLSSLHR